MYVTIRDFQFQRFKRKRLYILTHAVRRSETQYIEAIEHSGKKYIHFLRPHQRRAGRGDLAHRKGALGETLFTSMLTSYYDINAKDEFEPLFKETYIYDHPTKERNNYYMLRFDFSGLNTINSDSLIQTFHNRVFSRCKAFLQQYHMKIEIEKGIDAVDCLSQFLDYVSTLLKAPIYVIIDE